MKKVLLLSIIGLFLISTTACGNKTNPTAVVKTNSVEVIRTVDAFGTIKAVDTKNITIDFASSVMVMNVKEGQKVKLGDVLATLDLSEYETQIKVKELELQSIRNEINRLSPQNSNAPDIKKLLNDIKSADSLFNKASIELKSKEELFNAGSISQSELDEFKKTVDSKRKDIEDIQFTLASTKSTLSRELEQNITKAASLEFDLKIIKDKLNKSYIKQNQIISDFQNAVVFNIGYTSGDITGPTKSLLSLINLNNLVAEARVNEEFIKDVKIGSIASITPLADKSKVYKGKVIYISDKAETNNGETTIPVQISIDNKDDFLIPDFNIDVKIDIDKKG